MRFRARPTSGYAQATPRGRARGLQQRQVAPVTLTARRQAPPRQPCSRRYCMKLRHIALSLAAASTIAAAAPSFAEDVVVVSPAPATVTPLNPPSTSDTTTVYVAPP